MQNPIEAEQNEKKTVIPVQSSEKNPIQKVRSWFLEENSLFKMPVKNWHLISVLFGLLFLNLLFVLAGTMNLSGLMDSKIGIGILAVLGFVQIFIAAKLLYNAGYFFFGFGILLSGAAFASDKYLFNHEVFAPFSTRTTVLLWITFSALTLSSLYRLLPGAVLAVIRPLLGFGAILCIPFIITLLPICLFAWVMIPFAGLGLLPYSPIFAFILFIRMFQLSGDELAKRGQTHYQKYSFGASAVFLLMAAVYSVNFFIDWSKSYSAVRQLDSADAESQKKQDIFPKWARAAEKLEKSDALEYFLMPERRVRNSSMFSSGKKYDPLSFLSSLIFSNTESGLSEEEKNRLLRFFFGYSDEELERLWSGVSLVTESQESVVEIDLASRTAYTETKLKIRNEKKENFRPEEALYTVSAPSGSIITSLSLWINGKEEEGRLAFKSQAKKAYETIVGVERRDPSLAEWLEDGRWRLRVFPVEPGNFREVKIGIISPLIEEGSGLRYSPPELAGPPYTAKSWNRKVRFSGGGKPEFLDGKASYTEKENGIYESSSLSLPNQGFTVRKTENPSGKFRFAGFEYTVSGYEKTEYKSDIESIILYPVDSSEKESFLSLIENLSLLQKDGKKVYLYGSRMLPIADLDEGRKLLNEIQYRKFPAFPFNEIDSSFGNTLIISGKGRYSVPYTELKNSEYYRLTEEFFQTGKNRVFLHSVSGGVSDFWNSFLGM
ncbi:MAG TPA: XrtN system VIT domain-containing protein, partial [Leptospiraceae bacterium]|nr:XrtN system VIT domain-containing protein [Leptospiraceae bacterium]